MQCMESRILTSLDPNELIEMKESRYYGQITLCVTCGMHRMPYFPNFSSNTCTGFQSGFS